MQRAVTIRFAHIDGAGVVFYPRYFELLAQAFPELEVFEPPFAIHTEFLRPNYLGDELDVSFESDAGEWTFRGRLSGKEHFIVKSLPDIAKEEGAAPRAAFTTDVMAIEPWMTDATTRLQFSRYFELLSFAVEEWFADSLDMTFRKLHGEHDAGIPTVLMHTRCRDLPRLGDVVEIRIAPTKVGTASLTYTSWMLRGDECLLANEQTIVFIRREGRQFHSIRIPDALRERLQEQHVAA